MKLPANYIQVEQHSAAKLCECGCGQPTKIARKTASDRGHVRGQPFRFVYGHHPKGQNNPCWTGDSVGYHGGHFRVSKDRGKPAKCEECGLSDPSRKYHWANISGNWHDIYDYRRMCVPCHRKFDYRRRSDRCKHGHVYTPQTTFYTKQGHRECRVCMRLANRKRRAA